MDLEAEVVELKRRMDELEAEVEGEKLVTRHIFEAVRRTETKVDRLETKVDDMDSRLTGVESDVAQVKSDVSGLRRDLPDVVGNAVRDAMREK